MQILLGESDSFLHDGTAKIVIVHVTLDSGKKVQFPYPANKPIWKIYEAVSNISDENIVAPAVSHAAEVVAPVAVVPLVSTVTDSSDGMTGRWSVEGDGVKAQLRGNIWRIIYPKTSVVDNWKEGRGSGTAVKSP